MESNGKYVTKNGETVSIFVTHFTSFVDVWFLG